MNGINVLLVHRKGLFELEGGEQDQVRKTMKALEDAGAHATLCDQVPDKLAQYDIAHFFCVDASHIEGIRKCRGMAKVLSPVFWDRSQAFLLDDIYDFWPRRGREILDRISSLLYKYSQMRNRRVAQIYRGCFHEGLQSYVQFQQVIDEIDMFLPNSHAEASALSSFYVISDFNYVVVPNAIDPLSMEYTSDYAGRYLPQQTPFVLCAGGINRRKNQYSLLKAMMDIDVPLVFAGSVREESYYEALNRAAARRKGVFFVGHLSQPDLHSVYNAAQVHALPSFHETPGIANLEAVAHGCANVSTQIGGLREYLGEHSLYCNPFSVEHIREQVLRALDMPPNLEGSKLVRSSFTYERVAQATLEAYSRVL